MKYCVLMASPRKKGNTMALTEPFLEESRSLGAECPMVRLYDKRIEPCIACRTCQADHSIFGCRYQDDVQDLFDQVMDSEVIVLASPIYSWFCTPPMKALLDRFVYGMNKYYGDVKGPALWAGKKLALITTCGYPPEKGADLWEKAIIRYCKHSRLNYRGMLAAHDPGYKSVFMNQEKEENARRFARQLLEQGTE